MSHICRARRGSLTALGMPFDFPSSRILFRTLSSSRTAIRFHIFQYIFVSIFLTYIGSSMLVPSFVAHNPSTSCTRSRLLSVHPLFSTCRVLPHVMYPIFPPCAWSLPSTTLVLHIVIASSCFCYTFHISYTGTCLLLQTVRSDASLPPFLVHEGPLLFWLGLKFFTIFPYFFSFLLGRACSCLRNKSSTQHRSFFCQLIRFLIAFSINFSKSDTCCLSFFVRCALTFSTKNRRLSLSDRHISLLLSTVISLLSTWTFF